MAFDINESWAWVNKGTRNIPVYSSHTTDKQSGIEFPSGSQIGTIYPNEMYTTVKQKTIGWAVQECTFRNSSGQCAKGWIHTNNGYMADPPAYYFDQKAYHLCNSNGTALVDSEIIDLNGKKHRQFKVNKAITMVDHANSNQITLPVGCLLATDTSEIGNTQLHRMLFRAYKTSSSAAWSVCYANGAKTYGYVDLGFEIGSGPSNRAIR